MHNRHYIIINAEDEEQARFSVEGRLDEFGDENNYYSIVNILDVKDENNREVLQNKLDLFNSMLSEEKIQELKDSIARITAQANDKNRFMYYQLSALYKNLYETVKHKNKAPYTFEEIHTLDDYYSYQYDEYGVTNSVWDYDEDKEHIFFVEVDVHS